MNCRWKWDGRRFGSRFLVILWVLGRVRRKYLVFVIFWISFIGFDRLNGRKLIDAISTRVRRIWKYVIFMNFLFKLDYRYCCWLLDDFEKFGMEFKNIAYLYIYILKTILLRNRMKFEIHIASLQWFNSNNDYCDILAEGRKFQFWIIILKIILDWKI